jgi:hypothetical protein
MLVQSTRPEAARPGHGEDRIAEIQLAVWKWTKIVDMYKRLAVLAAALVISCNPAGPRCIPGTTIECPCSGIGRGTQTCKADGTYATCSCQAEATVASSTPEKKSAACNAVGRWQFRGVFAGKGAGCSHQKSFNDTFILARDRKGHYALRARMVNGEHKFTVKDDADACVIEWEEEVDEIPVGSPDIVQYKMALRESGGEVSGEGTYRPLNTDKPGEVVARCEEAFSIKGTKKELTKADLEIDKAIVRRDFETFIQRCGLPMPGKGARANIEATIGARGGLDALMINGVDQDVNQNCEVYLTENRLGLFPNPTARRQKVAFVYP